MPEKIVIKSHRNRNEYLLTNQGLWVRNFARSATPLDINELIDEDDYKLLMRNEMMNMTQNMAHIDVENITAPNVVIVSDGYKFTEKQYLLAGLNVVIIGTNRSLPKWNMKSKMGYYVVNNPYKECMSSLPEKIYYPTCIASIRTFPEFILRYKQNLGVLYYYVPTPDKRLGTLVQTPKYYVDDYRNSICAAINLAYHWRAQRILLFCTDDAFEGERPGAEKLANGLYMYPQHHISQDLLEANLFWLLANNNNAKVGHHSSYKYKHLKYINEDEIRKFFV